MVCMYARMTRLGGHARVELYLPGTGVKDWGRLIDRPLCVQGGVPCGAGAPGCTDGTRLSTQFVIRV